MTLNVRTAPICAEVAGADQLDHAPVVLAGVDLGADLADASCFLTALRTARLSPRCSVIGFCR